MESKFTMASGEVVKGPTAQGLIPSGSLLILLASAIGIEKDPVRFEKMIGCYRAMASLGRLCRSREMSCKSLRLMGMIFQAEV